MNFPILTFKLFVFLQQLRLLIMKKSKTSQKLNKSASISQQVQPIPTKNIPKEKPDKLELESKDLSPQKSDSKSRKYLRSSSLIKGKQEDLQKQIENKQKQINFKKQKMCACVELFNLLQGSSSQLRCTQHNNVLTLYCLTQRKVLCVNCNFGEMKHKTHKILPLKDSGVYINEDNLVLKELLSKDLKTIEDSVKNCQEMSMSLEKQMKKMILDIQKEYEKKIAQIKYSYQSKIKKVKDCYSGLIDKSGRLQKEIQTFKFKIWQTLSKIGIGKKGDNLSNQIQIVRQVFCSNIVELTSFQINKITKKQLQRLSQKARQHFS